MIIMISMVNVALHFNHDYSCFFIKLKMLSTYKIFMTSHIFTHTHTALKEHLIKKKKYRDLQSFVFKRFM